MGRFDLVNIDSKQTPQRDFNKIKVGRNLLSNDVTADFDFYVKNTGRVYKRADIDRAMQNADAKTLRAISNHYYDISGIYKRLIHYLATMYRYDWIVTPWMMNEKPKKDKIKKDFLNAILLLDNSRLKYVFREIAIQVIREGVYYGYKLEQKDQVSLQKLPVDYCRSRYELNGNPTVEFNVKYFDDAFRDVEYRTRILKMMPEEFSKGYVRYLKGTAEKDFSGDDAGWILLDPKKAVRFTTTKDSELPPFVSVIPAIMDLEDAKDMDKKKMAQQLVRLIIQQMPIDNKGDLVFDLDEAQVLHNLAVDMVSASIGTDVLTTFADVTVADMSDRGTISGADQLAKVERNVFNEAGVSQKQFNTDGTTALEKSIANDESFMTGLMLQFQNFAESLLRPFNKKPKECIYKVSILPTTIYNYQNLAKLYKEETMIGYSKMLPAVALGHSQGEVLMTMIFENDVLNLDELLIPPQSSNTRSEAPGQNGPAGSKKKPEKLQDPSGSGAKGGRPKLPDDEKSEKTLRNIESQG